MAFTKKQINQILDALRAEYPEAGCALEHMDTYQLLIAVVLSAQATDKSVNRISGRLFEAYPTPFELAEADQDDVIDIIKTIGMYKTKSKNIIALAKKLVDEFGGEVPRTMEELQRLPGVGRKTANIVLNEGFGIVEGIAVDTHVFRVAHKLKFSNADTPSKTEVDLLNLYPREYWGPINHQWVLFGREVCIARRPRCEECFLCDLCPSCGKK